MCNAKEASVSEEQTYKEGDARAIEVGVIELKDGRIVRGMLLDFPAGPPQLPFSVVWNGTPLVLTIRTK